MHAQLKVRTIMNKLIIVLQFLLLQILSYNLQGLELSPTVFQLHLFYALSIWGKVKETRLDFNLIIANLVIYLYYYVCNDYYYNGNYCNQLIQIAKYI